MTRERELLISWMGRLLTYRTVRFQLSLLWRFPLLSEHHFCFCFHCFFHLLTILFFCSAQLQVRAQLLVSLVGEAAAASSPGRFQAPPQRSHAPQSLHNWIKFIDIDSNPHRVFRVHPSTMQFEKERGNNHYSVIGILDGFDLDKPLDHHDNKPLYEPWDTSVDFLIALGCIMKGLWR